MSSNVQDNQWQHYLLADESGEVTVKLTVLYNKVYEYFRCPEKPSETFNDEEVYKCNDKPYLCNENMTTIEITNEMHNNPDRIVFIQDHDCKCQILTSTKKDVPVDCDGTCEDPLCWGTHFDPYVNCEINVHKCKEGLLSDMILSYTLTNMTGEDDEIGIAKRHFNSTRVYEAGEHTIY